MRWYALAVMVSGLATTAAAQGALTTPEVAAQHFYATLRAHDWNAMAASMHPAALARFRGLFGKIITSPRGGPVRDQLFGGASADSLAKLSDAQFFAGFLRSSMGQDPA